MFTREISGLTLTSQVADNLFPNIGGNRFRNDESFVATLRAVMYNRVPKEESISLQYNNSRYTAFEIRGAAPADCIRAFLRNSKIWAMNSGILHVHSFDGDAESNDVCFDIIDSNLTKTMKGYEPLRDVAKWFEQSGKVRARIFLNAELKNVLIFIEKLDMKRWHLMQSLLPRYFPWYFKDSPRTEEETKLLSTLTKRYAPEYEKCIEEFAKKFDFRSQQVRLALAGFETRFERDKLNNVRNQITDTNRRIQALEDQFSAYYRQLAELNTQELGLIEKINRSKDGEDSELLEYFLCNKSLDIVSVRGSTIEFIVNTVLSNFDPDVFDSAIHRNGSFFYRHYETGEDYGNPELTDERIKKLMLAIFQDEKLKLRVCAAYRLGFGDGTYNALKNYHYPEKVLRDHTPNQHIQYYACLGNNGPIIREAMRKRDYIAAISACCSSASNVNFTESNTGTFFMQKICALDVGEIIQMPDGSTKTPVDAVKWLEEQETAKIKKEVDADV